MIRYHADHNVDLAIVHGLRRRRVDVTVARELDMAEATDEEHLEFAFREHRVLLTHDQDFLRLHSTGVDHFGIIHVIQQRLQIGRVVRTLEEYSYILDEEDFRPICGSTPNTTS